MLFLKYLDDLEETRSMEAELVGKSYERVIDEDYSWSAWAAPKNDDGSFDHDSALAGDDLIDYVDRDLFRYLQGFKERATSPDTIEYRDSASFIVVEESFISAMPEEANNMLNIPKL
jgi:type I restriction enzyme M protein